MRVMLLRKSKSLSNRVPGRFIGKDNETLRNANLQIRSDPPVGVADDGTVYGLEDDYATFSKRGERGDQDLWGQHLQNLIRNRLGDSVLSLINWEFHSNGHDLVRVSIDPSEFPVYERKGNDQIFWDRTSVGTIPVNEVEQRDRIIARR